MLRRLHTFIRSALVLVPFSVIAFVFLLTFTPAVITRAARYDSGSMDFVVGVDGSIAIMLPKTDISFMVDASKNEIASRAIQIGVDSNLTHGVVLGMTTAYSNMSADDVTGNGLNSVHSYTIPALDKTVHKSLFPVNHWGYSIDGGTYYNRMPAANDGFMAQIVIENPSVIDMQEVYIGAKADISQPLDYYYTTINFTAITNFAAKTIDDIIYMQEMTPEIVESMEINRQYRLRDSRDKKDYWVAKFEDGNVWMTQNLDLDLSPNLILTPEDSDITRVWKSTTTKQEVDYNRESSYMMTTTRISFKYGLQYSNGTYSYQYTRDAPIYGEDINECLMIHMDDPKFCNHFRIGQSYTWLEAVAAYKTDDVIDTDNLPVSVDESICPKGWRLPRRSFNESIVETDFPKTASTTHKKYDDRGLLVENGTLPNNLAREPYFFLDQYYWTSSMKQDGYVYIKSGNGNYNSFSSTSSISSTMYKVRCLARPTYSFDLVFDLNGGEGIVPESLNGESWDRSYTFQLGQLANPPTKDGYSLIGWSTDPESPYPDVISYGMDSDGKIVYGQDGRRITTYYETTSAHTKLYAVWEKSVRLSFNANGGKFTNSLYPGETEDQISIVYSIPRSGVMESEIVHFSSRDCDGNEKSNINDTTTYCANNNRDYTYNFGSGYDYVDVTIYYAVSGDSSLCVFNSSSNVYYGNCGNSASGNLALDAYFDASPYYRYTKSYHFTDTSSFGVAFYGRTNNDGKTNWYGYWGEAKAVKTNSYIQYRRSTRATPMSPTREGYRFVGWSTDPSASFVNWEYNGGVDYTEDVQLYAVWVPCPIVTVQFTTNQSDHVQIDVPSITWDTAKVISLQKNSRGQWQYYDAIQNDYVVIATVTSSSDRFYLVSSTASPQTLSSSLAQNLNDGDIYTVSLNYSEEPVENMHELTRESCAVSPLNTTQQLKDARDNKKYWVTKLLDGRCWMTQNLDLAIYPSPTGTTLTPETSNVETQQTIYASASWTTNTADNNYFDGGDYYYANGITPTSTEGLEEDSVEWHYHKGSYYNKKLSKLICPKGWNLGNYQELYNNYQINQPYALVFSTIGSAPLQAPFYQIIDYSTDVSKPPETNNQQYTLYWTSSFYTRDVLTVFDGESYATPLVFQHATNNPDELKALTNDYNNYSTYLTGGFVRCAR